MADDLFRTWSHGQITYYGCENFYRFSTEYLLRDLEGGDRPLEELEAQMERDVCRIPIILNGQSPREERWTKDTFIEALRHILGDTWDAWKAVMYKPFCAVLSQTIMAKGTLYFQTKLGSSNYILGELNDSHKVQVIVDPKDGTFELVWNMTENIVSANNPESPLVNTNVFTTQVLFSPKSGDISYNGYVLFSMDQSVLFDMMVRRSESIINEAVKRIERPIYSMTGYPATLNHPSVDTLSYFRRLTDRIVSALELRRREASLLPFNTVKYDAIQKVISPYIEGGEPVYAISPDTGDTSINFLLLIQSIIQFMKDSDIIRHLKFAQNDTTRGKGSYHIHELFLQIHIYILLRAPNGVIPTVRFRKSPHLSFFSANERYRMEKNAERAGKKLAQPTVMAKSATAETLTTGERALGHTFKFLGGHRTRRAKVNHRRNRQTSHIKSRKNHTC